MIISQNKQLASQHWAILLVLQRVPLSHGENSFLGGQNSELLKAAPNYARCYVLMQISAFNLGCFGRNVHTGYTSTQIMSLFSSEQSHFGCVCVRKRRIVITLP